MSREGEGLPTKESLLGRWSRRKQDSRGEESAHEPAAAETQRQTIAAAGLPAAAGGAEETPPPPLPPVESLDAGSDYRRFLNPEVAEDLRRLALRRLFHLPQFNLPDGLDDYAEDFREFKPLGAVVTHELRRMLEREAARRKRGEEARVDEEKDLHADTPAPGASQPIAAAAADKGPSTASEQAGREAKEPEEPGAAGGTG